MNAGEPSLLDALLDRAVPVSYSRLGYALRSRSFDDGELQRMDGRAVLVTGATSGLGAAAAAGFARLGATVWIVSRSSERGERVRAQICEHVAPADVRVASCDVASLRSVREFAESFLASSQPLDVLVHNAGVLAPERALSPDAIELTLATNVVGPFLLSELLRPLLADRGGRIVNVSSGGMYAQRLRLADLQSAHDEFRGTRAYAHTKRMQVILSELWARRAGADGVAVNAMHPGWVDTPGLREALPRFYGAARPLLRTPEQGADTIVWLGCSPQGGSVTGAFWLDRARRPTHLVPWTRETAAERERLWQAVETLALGSLA